MKKYIKSIVVAAILVVAVTVFATNSTITPQREVVQGVSLLRTSMVWKASLDTFYIPAKPPFVAHFYTSSVNGDSITINVRYQVSTDGSNWYSYTIGTDSTTWVTTVTGTTYTKQAPIAFSDSAAAYGKVPYGRFFITGKSTYNLAGTKMKLDLLPYPY